MKCRRSSPSSAADRQQQQQHQQLAQERIDLTRSPNLDMSWMSQISPNMLRHHGLDHYFGQQGSLSHSIASLSLPSSPGEQIASRRQYIQETLVAKVSTSMKIQTSLNIQFLQAEYNIYIIY
jgi:hypothetical protein